MTVHAIIKLGLIGLLLSGCAAHSTIAPTVLKKGESTKMVTLSAETVAPVITWRWGVTENSDFGFHVGFPVYGTGLDYSVALTRGEHGGGDIFNVGAFLMPNANIDVTYYKVGTWYSKKKNAVLMNPYYGWRFMIIPRGLNGNSSARFGFLFGLAFPKHFGLELGYFHDFIDGNYWYKHTIIPSEKNPLTGVSLRFSFYGDIHLATP